MNLKWIFSAKSFYFFLPLMLFSFIGFGEMKNIGHSAAEKKRETSKDVFTNIDELLSDDISIIDSSHYSQVFGERRNYRIFLPRGYDKNAQKRYPVIYFFHGWSERYFGRTKVKGYDDGEDNEGDNIANFVRKRQVIIVKADGYDADKNQAYNFRPYNIGRPASYRQFPIYFPELVHFIDANYNTVPDRNHRAVSGLSMGGFMAFWIGGKYPDMLSAVGNFCGSAEFFVGPPAIQVEYRHLDMYKNYSGMKLRLNYGDKDFIRYYHQDMNREWPRIMDNYEYKIYDADHSTCGMGEMFDFLLQTFKNPLPKPVKWSHIDVYPEFSVWDYTVSSDRNEPGFTILENVDKKGFRSSVRTFLPDGEIKQSVSLSILTPAIYEKRQEYIINDIDIVKNKSLVRKIMSDEKGRIKIQINGSIHEIGISKLGDQPNISIAAFQADNLPVSGNNENVSISIKLVNKGVQLSTNVKATLTATRSGTVILDSLIGFGNMKSNEIVSGGKNFIFTIPSNNFVKEKFRITIEDDRNKWTEFIEIPIRRNLAETTEFMIADGKEVMVANGGKDSAVVFLGSGNGDGIANPGESIVLLIKDKGQYRRTSLYSSDKYINPFGTNTRLSITWENLDHVGASEKYNIPLIAADCPQNHQIDFYAEYWLPGEGIEHSIHQKKLRIIVWGQDKTPPQIEWVNVSGDNTIRVKVYDGSPIRSVKAKFIPKERLEEEVGPVLKEQIKPFEVELDDKGQGGDNAEADNVFSKKLPLKQFGLYTIQIEAADSFGNKANKNFQEVFVVH